MSWSTVLGLCCIVAITTTATRLWTSHCKRRERAKTDARIKELDDELQKSIDEDCANMHEHLRLAAELDRLRQYRDNI